MQLQKVRAAIDNLWPLFADLPEAVTLADSTGQIIAVNDAAVHLFGCQNAEQLLVHLNELPDTFELHEIDGGPLPLDQWPLARVMRGERYGEWRLELRRRDTQLRVYCSFTGAPAPVVDNQVGLVTITARDVTSQVQAERALAASEAFYRSLDDALPHLVWTLDTMGRFKHVNTRWMAYTGLSAKEANQHGHDHIWHPDDLSAHRSRVRDDFLSGRASDLEIRLRRKDGQYRWFLVRMAPVISPNGQVNQWIGTATDIHDLKLTQERLSESEERLRLVANASSDGLWEWDLQTNELQMSSRFFELLGVSEPSETLTIDWIVDRTHPDDRAARQQALKAHLEHGKPYSIEVRMRRGDENGAYGYFVTHGIAQRDASGRPVRILGAIDDITDRRNAEQALREARDAAESANRAKDNFLAILSHELRTPLTPVLLFSSSLERNPDLPEEVRADLSLIRQQIQLEARLIDDLLDLTRIQRGKMLMNMQTVSLHDVLRRVAGLSTPDALANDLQLMLNLEATHDIVEGDPARLQQLFSNIVTNAIKFTSSRGTIHIHSANRDEWIVVEITDTGIGIAPGMIGTIFNAFEQAEQSITRRFGGLGLGLTIGKAITEMHHGRISAYSEGENKGTTLRVELPLLRDPIPQATSPENQPARRRQRVLLVEDHEPTRQILERLLAQIEFDVISADSVAAAIHLANRHEFDILLSDIGLGDGTGIDVLRQLAPNRSFRAIALSGFGTDDDIQRSLDAGFEAHLVKPVDITRLELALRDPAHASQTS